MKHDQFAKDLTKWLDKRLKDLKSGKTSPLDYMTQIEFQTLLDIKVGIEKYSKKVSYEGDKNV